MSVRIKICGITNADDALAAVEAGADALGFMFYQESPRFVSRRTAAAIIRALPPFVAKVGVFADGSEEDVRATVGECGLDTLQFHGEEPPHFCQMFRPLKIIKAFRVRELSSLKGLDEFETDAWLLDSYTPGRKGGTGTTFNWELARDAKALGKPVILAGGLNAENVAQAVQQVRPFGVDVSSGVESCPGRKDRLKITEFIAAARGARA